MKRFFSAIVAVLLAPSAYAADMGVKAPVAPAYAVPYTWSGPWIGLYIGGAINSTNAQASMPGATIDIGNTPRGVVGGVGLGYDFQFAPNWVAGLFLEGALADISNSGGITGSITNHMATNYLLGAGGRLGLLITPSTMLYAKGGAAGVGEKPNWQVGSVDQGVQDTAAGYVIGGGLEHRLNNNWSVKVEYEHFHAGDKQFGFTNNKGNVILTAANKTQIDMATVGLNFRF